MSYSILLKKVAEYNYQRIHESIETIITVFANDELITRSMKEESKIKYLETLKSIDHRKCYGLFYELELKINIKYMIVINIDVSDGLVNGTTGMLKQINLDSNNVLNEIIWFDFHLDKIGHKTSVCANYANI